MNVTTNKINVAKSKQGEIANTGITETELRYIRLSLTKPEIKQVADMISKATQPLKQALLSAITAGASLEVNELTKKESFMDKVFEEGCKNAATAILSGSSFSAVLISEFAKSKDEKFKEVAAILNPVDKVIESAITLKLG